MPTPYMGLGLPTPGPNSAVPDWGNLLNTAFALIDSHDHTPGHGLPVPTAGISINADLTFGGFNLTQARTLRLQQQSAAPSLASDAGCLYLTTAGDLWWNNGAGQHVQITSGAALSAASLGGISGMGGTSANVAFSNSTKTFTFSQAANQSALLDAGPLVIHDTAASAFGITLQSPVGIAGAYALTLPVALPGATSVLTVSASGQIAAGPASSTLVLDVTASHTWGATQTFSNPIAGPSSTPVAITPNASWTAAFGLAYWKDPAGIVRLKGAVTQGGGISTAAFNLPAGFRPAASTQRTFSTSQPGGAANATVNAAGDVSFAATISGTYYVDAISFLAEA